MLQLTAQELAAFLPHAGEMRLIDSVDWWDQCMIRCRTSSHHRPWNPLRNATRLEAITGLEYAAQAMGIHVGVRSQTRLEPGMAGYVGAVRDVVLCREWLDDCLDDLIIEATCLLDDTPSFIYQFAISSGGQAVITGRASIFLKSVRP
jgi:predicted hotdog family 3-hydroxylacyl-ACP dehydratase